jgi:hypothetical protein
VRATTRVFSAPRPTRLLDRRAGAQVKRARGAVGQEAPERAVHDDRDRHGHRSHLMYHLRGSADHHLDEPVGDTG